MSNKIKQIIGNEVSLYQPDFYEDYRGDIWTSWVLEEYPSLKWRRDKFSTSKKGVLRGLHGDDDSWKLMSCVYGEVYFVVVNPEKNTLGLDYTE